MHHIMYVLALHLLPSFSRDELVADEMCYLPQAKPTKENGQNNVKKKLCYIK